MNKGKMGNIEETAGTAYNMKGVSSFFFFLCNLKTVAGVPSRVYHRLSITVM